MMKFEFCLLREFQTTTQKVAGFICQHLQVQCEGAEGLILERLRADWKLFEGEMVSVGGDGWC